MNDPEQTSGCLPEPDLAPAWDPSVHRKLALGHHQMVGLMVPTLHHDSHEAECLELGYLLRIIGRNAKLHSIR